MKKHQLILATIILAISIIIPRVYMLDAFTSPDESQWERNTQNFRVALGNWDLKNLYQQPHPGITTQWLASPTIHANTWGEKRIILATFLALSVAYIAYLVRRLWGTAPAIVAGFLLALNPLLIGHSRVLAMDALLTVFALAAVLHHLLWSETTQKKDAALTGIFTVLAILSKMSGIVLLPYLGIATLLVLLSKKRSWNDLKKSILPFCVAGAITLGVVFPTIITDFRYVWEGSKTFFTTEHFQQQVHALGPWWYPQAFLIWTTPIQLLGLLIGIFLLVKKSPFRGHILMLLLFCFLLFIEIQYSVKKGDRYMLPIFTTFDLITVGSFYAIATMKIKALTQVSILAIVLAVVWQVYEVARLHPYELAYRNPLFRSIAHGRTMGWGEGLDLAAAYLNAKEEAENILVAAYYEGPFGYHFKGKVTSAERLAKESAREIGAEYVVLYRTMEGRSAERWETKVLEEYAKKMPEHTVKLNGEEYAWIFKVE